MSDKRNIHMDGESIIVAAGHRVEIECCDCGLVHTTWASYDPQSYMVSITTFRNEELTKKAHRKIQRRNRRESKDK